MVTPCVVCAYSGTTTVHRAVVDVRQRRHAYGVCAVAALMIYSASTTFTTSLRVRSCPSAPARAPPRDDLSKLETSGDFSVGDVVSGRVVGRTPWLGVFIEIGAKKNALLAAPINMATKLEQGEMLNDLCVTKVNRKKGQFRVAFPDLAAHLADRFRPLSDFSVGEVVNGLVVGGTGRSGIVIDLFAERNALLDAPTSMATKLKPSELLKGLRVTKLDQEKGQFVVTFDKLDAHLAKRSRPLSDFAGGVVDGRVVSMSKNLLVFIDIGAGSNALLHAPISMTTKLKPNELLSGLTVTRVDQEKGQLTVTFPGLAEYLGERYRPLSDFAAGDVVSGSVVGRIESGRVFIDIGAERSALLHAPTHMKRQLEAKEELKDLRVTKVDHERGDLIVTLNCLRPPSDFFVGQTVDGVVVGGREDLVVLVDIGAEKDVLLDAPIRMKTKLKPKELLSGLTVTRVDPEKGQLTVTFPCLAEHLGERYRPLCDFTAGDVVNGSVVGRIASGRVFIDIGAERAALLHAPTQMERKLEAKQELKDLRVTKVDHERGELTVTFDCLRPASDFFVGETVDGVVVDRGEDLLVFVDIGAEKDVLLDIPIQFGLQLEANTMLKGLLVTKLDESKGHITVAFDGLDLQTLAKESWRIAWDEIEAALDGKRARDFEVEVLGVLGGRSLVCTSSGLVGTIRHELPSPVGTKINATLTCADRMSVWPDNLRNDAIIFSVLALHDVEEGQVVDARVARVGDFCLHVEFRGCIIPIRKIDISSNLSLDWRETFEVGEQIKCYVTEVKNLRLSLRALEYERGAVLRNRTEVFARAEETARKYRAAAEVEMKALEAMLRKINDKDDDDEVDF